MGNGNKIGIVSYGVYIPKAFETNEDVSLKSGLTAEQVTALGISKKYIPSKEDQPITMAVKAAKKALDRAEGITPDDVDVVIWTGEEYKDYIAQTAAIRLQEEVGCRRAWAFDLVGQGVTLIQGLRMAQDIIVGDDTVDTVLLAGGTRNVDLVDYTNPDTHFLMAYSASGTAMIIKKNYAENIVADTEFIVDSHMSDEVFVPGGGTEIPFSPDNLDSEIMFFNVVHPEKVAEYLRDRWARAISETATNVLSGQKADYLALRHLTPDDRIKVLGQMGIDEERSAPLFEWGHHGTNDVLISLDLGIKNGAVPDGSFVVMASGGIGFTYAAALIRWGRS
jgi:3-oxoacyl-[acyl-carrier-protein] synthase-3